MKITSCRWWLASIAAAAVAVSAVLATVASAGAGATSSKPGGLGQSSGLLPRDHLTLESAIQVNLSKETVRLPLYPGTANGQKVWYVLLDASDAGLTHDMGVNYAPKLANIAISGPAAVQTRACLHSSPQLTGSGADHAGDERRNSHGVPGTRPRLPTAAQSRAFCAPFGRARGAFASRK
jgi:hypothetical protein